MQTHYVKKLALDVTERLIDEKDLPDTLDELKNILSDIPYHLSNTRHGTSEAPTKLTPGDLHKNVRLVWRKIIKLSSPELNHLVFTGLCRDGYTDRVKFFIENGVDPKYNDSQALKVAVENKNLEIAVILVEAGADVNCHDGILFEWAIYRYGLEHLKYFVDKGGRIDKYAGAIFKTAAFGHQVDALEYLLSFGFDFRKEIMSLKVLDLMNFDTLSILSRVVGIKYIYNAIENDTMCTKGGLVKLFAKESYKLVLFVLLNRTLYKDLINFVLCNMTEYIKFDKK